MAHVPVVLASCNVKHLGLRSFRDIQYRYGKRAATIFVACPMRFDVLLLVCALLCGAAWREIYSIAWRSYKSFTHPDCASIYNG